jgi:PAS domain-containing protein
MTVVDHPLTLIYRIDAEGRINYVNPAWSEFARNNHGESVLPEHILGHPLLDSISDGTVRELYVGMIKRARIGQPVRFRYRCDAPDKRRVFEMDIRLIDGREVEFTSTLIREEVRPTVAVLEGGRVRDERMLRVCSWCQQVAMPDGRWVPVEEAVETLHLLESETVPCITHGICVQCVALMKTAMGTA